MFHVLRDGEDLVAILANVETEVVKDAIAKVDASFRKLIDEVGDDIVEPMCKDLGVEYRELMTEWTDVLVALLKQAGATEVDYIWHECVPKGRAE